MIAMWLTPIQAAERIGVSVRRISNYRKGLNLDASEKPLKFSVLPPGRRVVIKDSWIDEFVEQFATQESTAGKMADEIMGKIKGGRR